MGFWRPIFEWFMDEIEMIIAINRSVINQWDNPSLKRHPSSSKYRPARDRLSMFGTFHKEVTYLSKSIKKPAIEKAVWDLKIGSSDFHETLLID
jgi:hypothetical protein